MSSLPDTDLNTPHHLYRCYTVHDVLLYIGVAAHVGNRMTHHLADCNRGKQPNGSLQRHMAYWISEQYPTKVAARAAERAACASERPLLNRQHNPDRFCKSGTSTYALVEPVHSLTAEAFPELDVTVLA